MEIVFREVCELSCCCLHCAVHEWDGGSPGVTTTSPLRFLDNKGKKAISVCATTAEKCNEKTGNVTCRNNHPKILIYVFRSIDLTDLGGMKNLTNVKMCVAFLGNVPLM